MGERGSVSRAPSGFQERRSCGMVDLKMSSMQAQVLSHTWEENLAPLEMTRFSRQLVPDLASCSLSVDQEVGVIMNSSEAGLLIQI